MAVIQTIVFWTVIFGIIAFVAWVARIFVDGLEEFIRDDIVDDEYEKSSYSGQF
jgi:hypothetical protein